MLDHMTLTVQELDRSKRFYAQALGPLGSGVQMEFEGTCGVGEPGKPFLWLHQGEAPVPSTHVAFTASDRGAVDAFYEAAMAAGGRDNGPPGIREDYHPSYYAAFVLDPDGHNVEAVCHEPPRTGRRHATARSSGRTAGKAPKKAASASRRRGTRSARKPSRKAPRKARRASRGR